MKVLLLALFVAAVAAVPLPEDGSDAVEMIVNGVPDGEALEIGHIVDIKLKEHTDGELVSATNLLHPYTAVGIAEAEAVAAVARSDGIIPEPIALPAPVAPEVVPEPVVLPAPVAPEVVPEPVVLPAPVAPEVVPEPVVLPAPVAPEVFPEPIVLPAPAAPEIFPEPFPDPIDLPAPVAPEVFPEPIVLPAPAAPEVFPEPIVLPAPVAPEVFPEPIVLPAPVLPEVEQEVLPVPAPQFPEGDLYNDGIVQVSINGPEDPSILATLQSWFNMFVNYINNGVTTSHQIV